MHNIRIAQSLLRLARMLLGGRVTYKGVDKSPDLYLYVTVEAGAGDLDFASLQRQANDVVTRRLMIMEDRFKFSWKTAKDWHRVPEGLQSVYVVYGAARDKAMFLRYRNVLECGAILC